MPMLHEGVSLAAQHALCMQVAMLLHVASKHALGHYLAPAVTRRTWRAMVQRGPSVPTGVPSNTACSTMPVSKPSMGNGLDWACQRSAAAMEKQQVGSVLCAPGEGMGLQASGCCCSTGQQGMRSWLHDCFKYSRAPKWSGSLISYHRPVIRECSHIASIAGASHTLEQTWQAISHRMHSLDLSRPLTAANPPSALQRESSSRQWKMSLAPKEWPIRVTGRSPWPPASSRTARRCPAF